MVRIIYDKRIGGVRIVKAALLQHTAAFTCNEALGHCTVQVEGDLPLAPAIGYVNGQFLMTYMYTSVTRETEAEFETAYAAAKRFCREAGPEISRIRAAIEDGEPLEQDAP